jgi:hypothetical protein
VGFFSFSFEDRKLLLPPSLVFMGIDKDRSRRFGEPAKFLPVIFVVALIATVYAVYTYVCHKSNFTILIQLGTSFPITTSECG